MTREEKIKKLDDMAKPRSEEAIKKSEERKKQREVIDRACEWLRNNWRKYINIDADGVVCFGHWENDFRKAMKGD